MRLDKDVTIYKEDELVTKGFQVYIDYSTVWKHKDRWIYLGKILLLLANFKREGIFNIYNYETLANCEKILVEITDKKEYVIELMNYLNTEIYKCTNSRDTLTINEITDMKVYNLRLEEENFNYVGVIILQD